MVKTPERILRTALCLFNERGEPNVTTNHIAAQMEISPGNLYYHYRNKQEIIHRLFERFEQEIIKTLETPRHRAATIEDLWFYLHSVFEAIWRYRFIYRDLDNLLSRDRTLAGRFRRLIERGIDTITTIARGLVEVGSLRANETEIAALAVNITLITTYWLSFQKIHDPSREQATDHLGRGVHQALVLLAPHLPEREQAWLNRLSQGYLD